jgi:hypothetical protein
VRRYGQKPLPARIGQRDESFPWAPVDRLARDLGKRERELRGVHAEQPNAQIALGLDRDGVAVVDLLCRASAPGATPAEPRNSHAEAARGLEDSLRHVRSTHDSGRALRLLRDRE